MAASWLSHRNRWRDHIASRKDEAKTGKSEYGNGIKSQSPSFSYKAIPPNYLTTLKTITKCSNDRVYGDSCHVSHQSCGLCKIYTLTLALSLVPGNIH